MKLVGAGGVVAVWPGCSLSATPAGAPADLASPPDLGAADLAGPDFASCGNFNTGVPPGAFLLGDAVVFNDAAVVVCRDAGGLFAVTAVCTHEGCIVRLSARRDLFCPCHGSEFTFDGDVVAGPATQPLVHLALCLNDDGTVGVDTTTPVGKDVRLAA